MALIAESRRNAFWFGTEEKMMWMPTPNRGAQTGGSGWSAEGTTLNGGGFQLNSFGSHRQYIFEWPSTSSAKMAQLMKSYADGSFGRGLIYFIDPLIYTTNVLPAMWADPSMGIGQEGASLVYGVEASGLPTSGHEVNSLPVASAYYDLTGVAPGWRGKEDAVFIPIPDGYTLSLGSIHSQSGQGRVMYRTQSRSGGLGTVSSVTPLPTSTSTQVNTFISGPDVAGAWLFVGKAGAGAGSVTLTAMTGRLLPTVKAVVAPVATNLFTNPRLVGDGTWAEVRRNLCANPIPTGNTVTTGWQLRNPSTSNPAVVDGDYLSVDNITSGGGIHHLGTVTVSEATTFSATILAASGLGVRMGIYNLTTATWLRSVDAVPADFVSDGNPIRVSVTQNGGYTIGDTLRIYYVRASGQTGAGAKIAVRWQLTEAGTLVRPYFDGSTSPEAAVGVDQPEDFRWRWLGDPNESESVMEIEQVAGLAAAECVAGMSTRHGESAVRLIPTGASTDSYAYMDIPVVARSSGTWMGAIHTTQPLSGSLFSGRALGLMVNTPVQLGPTAPNEAGSYPLRMTYSAVTTAFRARLYHGGTLGSGDVWWTDIGLYAGTYDGPVFNGSSGLISIGPHLATTEWDGAIDNSTSTAYSTSKELIDIRKGPWIGGQGHSGCRFIGKPTEIKYGPFNGGQVGFAASFREVGSWLYG